MTMIYSLLIIPLIILTIIATRVIQKGSTKISKGPILNYKSKYFILIIFAFILLIPPFILPLIADRIADVQHEDQSPPVISDYILHEQLEAGEVEESKQQYPSKTWFFENIKEEVILNYKVSGEEDFAQGYGIYFEETDELDHAIEVTYFYPDFTINNSIATHLQLPASISNEEDQLIIRDPPAIHIEFNSFQEENIVAQFKNGSFFQNNSSGYSSGWGQGMFYIRHSPESSFTLMSEYLYQHNEE